MVAWVAAAIIPVKHFMAFCMACLILTEIALALSDQRDTASKLNQLSIILRLT